MRTTRALWVILLSGFLASSVQATSHHAHQPLRYQVERSSEARPTEVPREVFTGLFESKKSDFVRYEDQNDQGTIEAEALFLKADGNIEIRLKKNGKTKQVTLDDDGIPAATLTLMALLNQVKDEDWKDAKGRKVKDWDKARAILIKALGKAGKAYDQKYVPKNYIERLKLFKDEWALDEARGRIDDIKDYLKELDEKLAKAKTKAEKGEILIEQDRAEKYQVQLQEKIDGLSEKIKEAGGVHADYLKLKRDALYALTTADMLSEAAEALDNMKEAPTYADLGKIVGAPLNRIYNKPPAAANIESVIRHGYGTEVDGEKVKIGFINGLPGSDKLYLNQLWEAQDGDFTKPSSRKVALDFKPAMTEEKIIVNPKPGKPPIPPRLDDIWDEVRPERPIPLRPERPAPLKMK